MLNKPRAVMFDMDGLLLDSERLFLKSFVQARRDFGLADSPEVFTKTIGLRYDLAKPLIRANFDDSFNYDAFEAKWEHYRNLAFAGTIPRRPGAKRLMQLLKDMDIAIGVATSTDSKAARSHLQSSGLLEFVGPIVGGDMVDRPKPDPQPYLLLADTLGVAPADTVVFEDSDVGTRAAISSGARVVQVPDMIVPHRDVQALGHLIADSLLQGANAVGLIATQACDL